MDLNHFSKTSGKPSFKARLAGFQRRDLLITLCLLSEKLPLLPLESLRELENPMLPQCTSNTLLRKHRVSLAMAKFLLLLARQGDDKRGGMLLRNISGRCQFNLETPSNPPSTMMNRDLKAPLGSLF